MSIFNIRGYAPSASTALTVITAGLAINIVIGTIVRRLELPVYLDTIGTFIIVLLLGWRWGLVAAALSVAIGSLLIFPLYFFYSATAIGIVLAIEGCRNLNGFVSARWAAMSGIVVALTAAILSAPVTVFAFKGITATGNDYMTAFFVGMGNELWKSVLASGLASEPVDKVISALLAYAVVSGLPRHQSDRYGLRPVAVAK